MVEEDLGGCQFRTLTVRREQRPLFTSLATGDSSSGLVEAYRLHSNAIKALARWGQGACSPTRFAPVVYPLLSALSADDPLPRKNQRVAKGLRLYETFVA